MVLRQYGRGVISVPIFKRRFTLNNKQIGTAFEREMCEILADQGFWVHFLSPDNRGAQPFDLIFVKDGVAYVADCKTCKGHFFRWERLEDNQILAFEKWIACRNSMPMLFVKDEDGYIHCISYNSLKEQKKIDLREYKNVFSSREQD